MTTRATSLARRSTMAVLVAVSVIANGFAQDDVVADAPDAVLETTAGKTVLRRFALFVAELQHDCGVDPKVGDELLVTAKETVAAYLTERPVRADAEGKMRYPNLRKVMTFEPWASTYGRLVSEETRAAHDLVVEKREQELQAAARAYTVTLFGVLLSLTPDQLTSFEEYLAKRRFFRVSPKFSSFWGVNTRNVMELIKDKKKLARILTRLQRATRDRITRYRRTRLDDYRLETERLRIACGLDLRQARLLGACGFRSARQIAAKKSHGYLPYGVVEADEFWRKVRDSILDPAQKELLASMRVETFDDLVGARARLALVQLDTVVRLSAVQEKSLRPLLERIARKEVGMGRGGRVAVRVHGPVTSLNALAIIGVGFRNLPKPLRFERVAADDVEAEADVETLIGALDRNQAEELRP